MLNFFNNDIFYFVSGNPRTDTETAIAVSSTSKVSHQSTTLASTTGAVADTQQSLSIAQHSSNTSTTGASNMLLVQAHQVKPNP